MLSYTRFDRCNISFCGFVSGRLEAAVFQTRPLFPYVTIAHLDKANVSLL